MAEEGAVEKVFEAGLELINPGGQPEVLRNAAQAWRDLGSHLDTFAVEMDKKVQGKCGSEWRGPAADAFMDHWRKVKKSIEDSQDIFNDAAKGLDDAADNIEKVNEEIHQIYIEIGVTVAATLATSFITLGFSAAAGAANAARLAAQATAAAARLGRMLSALAKGFQALNTITRSSRGAKYLFQFGIEYGANVTTSLASGKGTEWQNNLVNAGFGIAGGAVAGRLLGNVGEGMAKSAGEGALGGALGSLGGDTANNLRNGEKFDASQMLIGAAGGAAGGGMGGGLKHGAMDRFAPAPADGTQPTPGDGTPAAGPDRSHYGDATDLALGKPSGIFAGEQANDAKDEDAGDDKPVNREQLRAENEAGAQTAQDHVGDTKIREDFG